MKREYEINQGPPRLFIFFIFFIYFNIFIFLRGFRLFRSLDLNVLFIHFLPFSSFSHHLWEVSQHRWPPACPGWHDVLRITSLSWCGVPSSFPSLGGEFSFGRAFSTCSYLRHARCEGKGLEEGSGPAVVSSQTQPLTQSRFLGTEDWNGVGISKRKMRLFNYFMNCVCRALKYFQFLVFFLHKKGDLYASSH